MVAFVANDYIWPRRSAGEPASGMTRSPSRVWQLLKLSARWVLIAAAGLGALMAALLITARYFDGHSLPGTTAPGTLILDNVNIISVLPGGVTHRQKLILRGASIAAIEPAGPPYPAGVAPIDLGGAFVMPGLFDMHVHIDDRTQLRQALAYGVTSVRNMDGMPFHQRWKDELANGQWLGATLYSTSPSLHGDSFSAPYDILVKSPKHAARLVQQFVDDDWDQIKVYSGLGLAEFRALIEAAATLGIGVVGHLPHAAASADYSLAGQMQSIEHVEEIFQGPLDYQFDAAAIDRIAQSLAATGSVLCPTLTTFEHLTRISNEKMAFVETLPTYSMTPLGRTIDYAFNVSRWLDATPEQAAYNQRELRFLQQIMASLANHNVALVAGTDAGTNFVAPGPSLAHELILMRDAGFSPRQVLEAATINAAGVLGVADRLGSIQAGKTADLVVTRDNPLQDLANLADPIAVVKAGRFITQSELVDLRQDKDHMAGWWVSAARYVEAILTRLFY